MGNMSRSNFVMQKVNDAPRIQLVVGTVDRVQGTLDKIVIVLRIVGNINVRVLEPANFIFLLCRDVRIELMINNNNKNESLLRDDYDGHPYVVAK